MTKRVKNILSIILGGLISLTTIGLIIGVVAFLWMLHLGYEPITETKDYIQTYGFGLILLLLVLIPFRLLKNKRPNISYGLLIGLIPIFLIFVHNTTELYDHLTPDAFVKNVWIESNPKPYVMTRYLMVNGVTDNLSRQEILELLGDDFVKEYSNDSTIAYQLDIARFAYFEIHFNKNEIVARTIYNYYD